MFGNRRRRLCSARRWLTGLTGTRDLQGRGSNARRSAIPVRQLRRASGRYPAVNGPWGQRGIERQLPIMPPATGDPIRPVTFLQTGQSAKSRFCELESPKRPLSTSHSGQLPPIVASGEPPSERLLHSATSPMAYSHCTARPNLSFTLLRGLRCTSASEHVVGRSNPTNSSRSRITQDGMQVVSVLRCHWAHRSIPILRILPSPPWPS